MVFACHRSVDPQRARFVMDVAAALDATETEVFDVPLSDAGLPDGTGWELLRRLKEAGFCPSHAIAMSDYGLDACLCESAAAGFDLHLIKPSDPARLAAILNWVVAQSGQQGMIGQGT